MKTTAEQETENRAEKKGEAKPVTGNQSDGEERGPLAYR
jgi:hypothetical protein